MFKPLFNHVLVEVDDKEAQWGKGNNESIAGDVYREGKVLDFGPTIITADYPLIGEGYELHQLVGKHVMWNEGHEAGKTFEENGKLYALIYWWDIVAQKVEE